MYAAIITRPDVAFAVSRLSRFNQHPGPQHVKAAERVLHYLKNTQHHALKLGGSERVCSQHTEGEGPDLQISSDASFADNTTDRKSSQGYMMLLFGGCVAWRASKQDTVTTSTTEAELLALAGTVKEGMFMSRLLTSLTIKLTEPLTIECDNKQTILLVNRDIATLKTKLRHVDIHNHWLRQETERGTVTITWVPTAKMLADGLTKALQGAKFQHFRETIGVVDIRGQKD